MYGEVNLLSKFRLPSSYGLGMKVCWRYPELWRYFHKPSVSELMNQSISNEGDCRTAPATPGLLNITRSWKAAQKTSHRLSRRQVVLTKGLFWSFVFNWVLSPIEFCYKLSFVTICLINFWVGSQFEFLSWVTILVLSQFEFCRILSFGVLSKF